jgi:hypothetical protein
LKRIKIVFGNIQTPSKRLPKPARLTGQLTEETFTKYKSSLRCPEVESSNLIAEIIQANDVMQLKTDNKLTGERWKCDCKPSLDWLKTKM